MGVGIFMTLTCQTRPQVDIGSNEVVVSVIREAADWDHIESEWSTLFAASSNAAPVLDWQWLRTWWNIYGKACAGRRDGLRILTVRRGTRLIGVLPLYARPSQGPLRESPRLTFLSSGEMEAEETCADYLDLLHLPGEGGHTVSHPMLSRLPRECQGQEILGCAKGIFFR